MANLRGRTWMLLASAGTLVLVAIAINIIVPARVAEHERTELHTHANRVVALVQAHLDISSDAPLEERFDRIDTVVRSVDNLWYLVLTDEAGDLMYAMNLSGAQRAGFGRVATLDELSGDGSVMAMTSRVDTGDLGTAHLAIGMSRNQMTSRVAAAKRNMILLGILCLIIAGILVYVWYSMSHAETHIFKLKRQVAELEEKKDILRREVAQHEQSEVSLRESEKRYKHLLTKSMQTAFADLEALNRDLERQKSDLEREVAERTRTQEELASTARRLSALNEIGRALLEEQSLHDIVGVALDRLEEIVPVYRASLIRYDEFASSGQILAVRGESVAGLGYGEQISLHEFWPFDSTDPGFHYFENIGLRENLSRVEERLEASGVGAYCSMLLLDGDDIAGALNIAADVPQAYTDQHRVAIREVGDLLSIALRQYRHQIERERYESELISAKDRAEEMARLKSAFLTNMSHEIRTPLSGIMGFAQLLDEEVGTDHQEFTGLILKSSKRLLNTINSVLDLATLEADRGTLELRPMSVAELVTETVQLLKPLADQKNLDLDVSVSTDVELMLDEAAFERVINNLVGNAIKFTNEGYVRVSVDRKGDEVELRVEDTGVGISEEFLPHLFDEFRQEEMGANRSHEGTGLGLAITRRLIERMNGRILVESRKGAGTTFCVRLSVAAEKNAEAAAQQAAHGSYLVVSDSLPDEEWSRIESLLTADVEHAETMELALAKARKRRFTDVLVDSKTLDLDRIHSQIRAIRDIPSYLNVRFILSSTEERDELSDGFRKFGFDDWAFVSVGLAETLQRIEADRNAQRARDRAPISGAARADSPARTENGSGASDRQDAEDSGASHHSGTAEDRGQDGTSRRSPIFDRI